MIEALIAGETDPDELAALAQLGGSRHRRRCCAKRCAAG